MTRHKGVHYRKRQRKKRPWRAIVACAAMVVVVASIGIAAHSLASGDGEREETTAVESRGQASAPVGEASAQSATESKPSSDKSASSSAEKSKQDDSAASESDSSVDRKQAIEDARAKLDLTKDFRTVFYHGKKPAKYQKYIVLHDTEGDSSPESVVSWWAGNGNLVAAHFVVGKDGSIVQCVPLDRIAHHAGYGNTGHNRKFGIKEDGRDDMKGTKSIGSSVSDYGMNAWSIGIEMVHVGGEGGYPKKQLEAVDDLIAYLDAYYGGNAGTIIDHKMWRSGNSDTSKEFAKYLKNYRKTRKHV